MNNRIVLASGSPRRRALLLKAGIHFLVDPANIEERYEHDERPSDLVRRLASEKATKVSSRHPHRVVLGADTVVFFDNQIIGKPASLQNAREVLLKLKGNTHRVYTGVCLTLRETKKTLTWFAMSSITFREFSNEELEYCLTTGNPLDKAGGYSFQLHKSILVSSYSGLSSNVIGLPIEEVTRRLAEISV